ncbi:DUF7619 domain-containing protein [Aquimarina sp. 2201CG14-23]|uniref:DUF7619 domain-containing protein n=1 Tax=Aquimarina mycalae TaxID=3040073 RepID=UPI002477F8D9|nr:T9SS type A sorting domain-containing protein [Aquimarina sp. 2201CG14-23]MDH7444819.1 T9SS type A sorting domain-containing protein [Aquimarina sp. 2201CG14-23]
MKQIYFIAVLLCISTPIFSQIVTIPDANFKQALLDYPFTIDTNGDNEIQVSEALAVTFLFLSDPTDSNGQDDDDIFDITGIEAFENLERFSLYSHPIQQIDVSGFSKLEILDLGQVALTSIDVSNNPNLTNLRLDDNNIDFVDVSNNPELVELDLRYNDLKQLDVSQNLKLKMLSVDRNMLTSIDVTNNLDLEEFYFYESPDINAIDLTNNTKLTKVSSSYNQITTINISTLANLESFIFIGSQIESIDFSGNPEISLITLSTNRMLSSVNLFRNNKVARLNLIGTKVEEIDVSHMSDLVYFVFWSNEALHTLNMQNGNNENVSTGNGFVQVPLLQFACVDDVVYANANFVTDGITQFVEICEEVNVISGTVRYDTNNDDCASGSPMSNMTISATINNNVYSSITDDNGAYTISIPKEGTCEVSLSSELPESMTNPANQIVNFAGFRNTEMLDFCINPTAISDLKVYFIPVASARPGFTTTYYLYVQNNGDQIDNGTVELEFDDQKVELISTVQTPLEQTNTSVKFSFNNLLPFRYTSFRLRIRTFPPPTVNGDDFLLFKATAMPIAEDNRPSDNIKILNQRVVNSYDPNDIAVLEGPEIFEENIDDYLNYRIRFQNTGTASAINVNIENILDPNLDWNTFSPTVSSHDYRIEITDGNKVNFIFDDINLPDSTSDEEGSNGFISYRIKPKSTSVIGDDFDNKADIFFDFNLPIITNEVKTTIVAPLSVDDFINSTSEFKVYPIPFDNEINVHNTTAKTIDKIELYAITGAMFYNQKDVSRNEISISTDQLSAGVYFIKLTTGNDVLIQKVIKE